MKLTLDELHLEIQVVEKTEFTQVCRGARAILRLVIVDTTAAPVLYIVGQ